MIALVFHGAQAPGLLLIPVCFAVAVWLAAAKDEK